jgi:hypothetical protein
VCWVRDESGSRGRCWVAWPCSALSGLAEGRGQAEGGAAVASRNFPTPTHPLKTMIIDNWWLMIAEWWWLMIDDWCWLMMTHAVMLVDDKWWLVMIDDDSWWVMINYECLRLSPCIRWAPGCSTCWACCSEMMSEHVVGESSQIGSGFFIREPYTLGNQKQKMKIKKMQGRL